MPNAPWCFTRNVPKVSELEGNLGAEDPTGSVIYQQEGEKFQSRKYVLLPI
jgi:hypothetical protein